VSKDPTRTTITSTNAGGNGDLGDFFSSEPT